MTRGELQSLVAERCETCRSEEMPYLWRCPAGVEGWTEGWHHAESDCDGFDDGYRCDASDLIDQHDPDGTILRVEVYDSACVCACHAGWASFGEDPGECDRCSRAADDYIENCGLTISDTDCAFGHVVRRAREAEARNERLVALLGKAQVTLIGAEYLLGRHGQSIDGWRELEPAIRAALHEEER